MTEILWCANEFTGDINVKLSQTNLALNKLGVYAFITKKSVRKISCLYAFKRACTFEPLDCMHHDRQRCRARCIAASSTPRNTPWVAYFASRFSNKFFIFLFRKGLYCHVHTKNIKNELPGGIAIIMFLCVQK
jgi:hypothetical protein